MAQGHWESAFERFERVGDMNRNDRHVWMPLTRHFHERQQYGLAAACLDHLEELAQYLPGLWIEYDEVYHKAGRRAGLLASLERMLELGQVSVGNWERLSELYERADQPDEAARCRARLEVLPRPPPQEPEQPYLDVARPSPELALEPEEDDPVESQAEQWIANGESHLHEGRADAAVDALNRARSEDIPRYRTWFRMGGLYYALGKLDEAEAAFGRSAQLNTQEPIVWYNMGVCQAEQGRFSQAEANFSRVLTLKRRFAKAWNWIGLLHFQNGRTAQARGAFVRCLAVNRESANAWHNLGMLYRATGREQAADQCLERSGRLGGVNELEGLASLKLPFGAQSVERAGLERL